MAIHCYISLFAPHATPTSHRNGTIACEMGNFKQLRNRVTHILRKSERAHATRLFRQTRLEPSETATKTFWQRKSKQAVIPQLTSNGSTAETDLEKAEMFNKFFSSQTLLENGSSLPDKSSLTPPPTPVFDSMKTIPKEVFDILCHLKKGKAAGIDEKTPDLLHLRASGIAESLSALFNKSFDSSKFPSQWKKALVVPIFKTGDKCCLGNYRPIFVIASYQ